ncbi:HVA22-like protein c [Vicia villosa]|uniref:HVA22-like protein c n=1 Tax=Vicia villosa TaxID=3911 RepID=UPI00273B3434|nr:HVA22-like protein c [Vicia villosa]
MDALPSEHQLTDSMTKELKLDRFEELTTCRIKNEVRLPIWPYAKLILSCWLVLLHFNGAAHVYRHYLRPFYMNPQMPQMPQIPGTSQMWYVPRKNIFSKQDDVLTAAERYMQEHGTEAFERLITKTDREARARRNGNYMIFDDDYRY